MAPNTRSDRLPPRPSRGSNNDGYARHSQDNYSNRDRGDYYTPQDRGPPGMYQFGGNGGDGYSNGRMRSPPRYDPPRGPRGPPPSDNYRPQQDDAYRGRGDNYRPSQQSYPPPPSFSFRHDAPTSIANHGPIQDSYAPRRNNGNNGAYSNTHNARTGNHNGPQRGGYRGRSGPRKASDRDFLKTNRAPTPELMTGMNDDTKSAIKYIPVEDVSDSSEADMDISDDEDNAQPKKQARTSKKAADGDSVPKWSNPDPYFALPPQDDSSRKKKDVVKLIRKARVEAAAELNKKPKKNESTDDFISFDFDESDHESKADSGNEEHISIVPNPDLGSRKRTIRDEIKDTPTFRQAVASTSARIIAPLIHKSSKGKKKGPAQGPVLDEWYGESTPWISIDHSDTAKMGVWLHKEIIDFYEHVKPRQFEAFIRGKLVEDLRERVQGAFPNQDILPFGSYPAGLYLPTADMDVVWVSQQYMNGGRKIVGQTKNQTYKIGRWLDEQRLPVPGSVEVVPSAKVPLVKYVDRFTGLRVDISFENDTGLTANHTFQDWKAKQPALPIIVTVIKHFLAMRGLNEPVNGGIGGFSVICLVFSLLEIMSDAGRDENAGQMVPEHHLGDVFMEFLKLYGQDFNWETTALQFNPAQYVSKSATGTGVYRGGQIKHKMCIVDPNNSENDIAGGSSNTSTITYQFDQAFRKLRDSMSDLNSSEDRQGATILGSILRGNYSSFKKQREHLRHVYEKLYGDEGLYDEEV